MQAGRKRGIGSWLGVFAIAMLFIGPPIGQWRAQVQREAGVVGSAGFAVSADRFASSISSDAHADHSVHEPPLAKATPAAIGHHAALVSQVGVLTLDHCGYCQLVACFAALPGAAAPLPALNWQAVAPLLTAYRAPHSAAILIRRARAPPVVHA